MSALQINGNDLSLDDLRQVVYERRPVDLADAARTKVVAAREVVEKLLRENRVAYAINTGVGKLSDVHIEPAQNRQLQVNLIRSHSAGVGEPLSQEETRAMMLLRANSLAKGFSGVRPEVIDLICAMLNKGVHPVVPSQGSVGASGDLAPLAHLALAMIGEGQVWNENARTNSSEALQRASIKPLVPEAKEAISLINGTQAMLAVGTLSLLAAETLAETADVLGAMSLDALHGTDVAFDVRIHDARPHAGQKQVAANLRRLLAGSEIRESH
ncbi:MAG TPA: aromatic amino acid lyase, partial [Candidatus Angelobacter sp.]